MINPRYAIVTPCYNSEKYLPHAVESVLAQTYENFELFLIDDGSTDATPEICNHYSEVDARIHVFHQSNAGVSSARNFALELIEKDGHFDYVCFLDSDDYWEASLLDVVRHHQDQLTLFLKQCFDKNGDQPLRDIYPILEQLRGQEILDATFRLNRWSNFNLEMFIGSVVFSADAIKGMRFSIDLHLGEDLIFLYQYIDRIESMTYVPRILYHYRMRRGSLCHKSERNLKKDIERDFWFMNYFKEKQQPEIELSFRRKLVSACWHYLANGSDDLVVARQYANQYLGNVYIKQLPGKTRWHFLMAKWLPQFLLKWYRSKRMRRQTNSRYLQHYYDE